MKQQEQKGKQEGKQQQQQQEGKATPAKKNIRTFDNGFQVGAKWAVAWGMLARMLLLQLQYTGTSADRLSLTSMPNNNLLFQP